MSKEFELFNAAFPNSTYREINRRYEGPTDNEEGHEKYQQSKAPINNKILSFDEIKDTKNRIGWIVPKDYVVVDIDNMLNAKNVYTILMRKDIKFMYMRGKNGGHFIFKNHLGIGNGAKYSTSIGISIDTRAMEKGYIILPENDKDRVWGNQITNQIDNIPFFLVPLKKLKVYTDFSILKDGDGRNSKLFEHFMNLKDYASELSVNDKIESIRIINTFILSEPLPVKELDETLLRDSVIEKLDKVQTVAGKEEIATDIVNKYNIIMSNDNFYKYNGKYYEPIHANVIERIIHTDYNSKMLDRDRKEIVKFIQLKAWVPSDELNKTWNEITVRNGVLNISEKKLYPHSPLTYNTVYVDRTYNPDVKRSQLIDEFFDWISNEEESKKLLLYEIIGYCFLRSSHLDKFFICYGEGGTGKSTYLELMTNLIGKHNVVHLSLSALTEKFETADLFGKLANIGDDISSRIIEDNDMIKKLISGEPVTVAQKFKESLTFNNFAKFIYTANKVPAFQDRSSGMMRRMMLIELNRKIQNADPLFMKRITQDDYDYLFYKAISAIYNVLQRNAFTNVISVGEALKVYRQSQSSVLSFIADNAITRENIDGKAVMLIYTQYRQYCEECGYKPLNQLNFKKELCDELRINILITTNGPDTAQQTRFRI